MGHDHAGSDLADVQLFRAVPARAIRSFRPGSRPHRHPDVLLHRRHLWRTAGGGRDLRVPVHPVRDLHGKERCGQYLHQPGQCLCRQVSGWPSQGRHHFHRDRGHGFRQPGFRCRDHRCLHHSDDEACRLQGAHCSCHRGSGGVGCFVDAAGNGRRCLRHGRHDRCALQRDHSPRDHPGAAVLYRSDDGGGQRGPEARPEIAAGR
ncbi:hypothetical protein FQZ97_884310 [compost metagenome]